MKSNKKLISLLTITLLCISNIIRTESNREPVLAEAVEMPGNVVGSLFGGGYAKREHDKHDRKRDEKEIKSEKPNKKSKNQPANRRQARRQRRKSNSFDE